jgi:hypothetical protein
MATNKPRHGYERKRSQLPAKTIGRPVWTKRDHMNGEFIAQKKTPRKYKAVRREKSA